MEFVLFALGAFIGSMVTLLIMERKAAYGEFRVDSVLDEDDSEGYAVKISISDSPSIIDKRQIILKRDSSQR